ncbi:hypothetical protein BOTBODRAFT_173518 [Botryobasidium botryosum FD-172 SS1]|uniref:Uncharacterized protein n=1 Tax=Botryobasidium botryosum (strain FD-172 SS1) TaxID=930990 RepID=A0A067MVI3_BOTB1|nr:hypothetical protein BOTBODRAFT_173518 [Botryobasidium botryosum FD-172 SS1]
MRITGHAKLRALVTFGLTFLQEKPGQPLVLHTLPAEKSSVSEKTSGTDVVAPITGHEQDDAPPPAKKQRLSPSTESIPRLVSVAEIIKREFSVIMAEKRKKSANNETVELHQWNEVGCLEDLQGSDKPAETEADRAEALLLALEGKKFLKQQRTPYMKITLCTQLIQSMDRAGVTYQAPPPPPKPSKAALARARTRRRKREFKEKEKEKGEEKQQERESSVDIACN